MAFGVLKAVAIAFRLQDVAAIRESIQNGTVEMLTANGLGTVFEWQVRDHDQAVSLVHCRDDIEEAFGSGLAGGVILETHSGHSVLPTERIDRLVSNKL